MFCRSTRKRQSAHFHRFAMLAAEQITTERSCTQPHLQVVGRPCPILDIVNLGKRKTRSDGAVELCGDGAQQAISLNIQDGRHKCASFLFRSVDLAALPERIPEEGGWCRSKAKNQNQFKLPWVAPETTQAEMYNTVKPVVDKFLAQRTCDCALLAYGATGSGKTYSMQGPKRVYLEAMKGVAPNTVDEEEGILQRCLQHVFKVCFAATGLALCCNVPQSLAMAHPALPGPAVSDVQSELPQPTRC